MLSVGYEGFAGGDSAQRALKTQAAAQLNVRDSGKRGTSVIDFKVEAVLNDTVGKNYVLRHVNGTLTVGEAPAQESANGSLQTGWVRDASGGWRFYAGNRMQTGWYERRRRPPSRKTGIPCCGALSMKCVRSWSGFEREAA